MPFDLKCLETDDLRQADSLIAFITKGGAKQHPEFVPSVVATRLRKLRLYGAAQLCHQVQAEIGDAAATCSSELVSAAFARLSNRLSAIRSEIRRHSS